MKKLMVLLSLTALLQAKDITLPAPNTVNGAPLYEVLKNRATHRTFDRDRELTETQISQILWAAAGRNRKASKKRTAPSAWGNNEVELYVLLTQGIYKYDDGKHTLVHIAAGDFRKDAGEQNFVKKAPMSIVLVGDLSKIKQTKDKSEKLRVANLDAGYISQNIYLASYSEGLITGARAWIDFEKLSGVLKLTEDQHIIVANSVGYSR